MQFIKKVKRERSYYFEHSPKLNSFCMPSTHTVNSFSYRLFGFSTLIISTATPQLLSESEKD